MPHDAFRKDTSPKALTSQARWGGFHPEILHGQEEWYQKDTSMEEAMSLVTPSRLSPGHLSALTLTHHCPPFATPKGDSHEARDHCRPSNTRCKRPISTLTLADWLSQCTCQRQKVLLCQFMISSYSFLARYVPGRFLISSHGSSSSDLTQISGITAQAGKPLDACCGSGGCNA